MKTFYKVNYSNIISGEFNANDSRRDPQYIALAKTALKECRNIRDFAYWGEIDLGISWAFTVSQHRDSDVLTRSNFAVISEDMRKRFPEYVQIDNCNHWAVGWVEYITVRMLDNNGRLTRAGVAIIKWQLKLDDYPVASEDHYSNLKYEENTDSIQSELKYWLGQYGETSDDKASTLMLAIEHSPIASVERIYSEAYDRDGFIDTRELDETLISVAVCIGLIESAYPVIADRMVKLWKLAESSGENPAYKKYGYPRLSKIRAWIWREIQRYNNDEYATTLVNAE